MVPVRRVLLGVLLCTSCTRYAVTTRPSELARNAGELVTRGAATVYGPAGETVRVAADDQVDVMLRDGDTQHPAHLTVRELVAGCIGDADAPSCLARQAVDTPTTVRREFRVDGSRVATGLTFGVMGGAIGGCIAACQDSSDLQRDLAYGGVAVVGAMALFVVLMMLGGHD